MKKRKKHPVLFAFLAEAIMLSATVLVDAHTNIDTDVLDVIVPVLFSVIAFYPLIIAFKNNALIIAAQNNDVKKATHLIKTGADVDAKNDKGVTALMFSAFNNAADVAHVLIEAGADMDAKFAGGETALMFSALNNAADAARVLIEAGAEMDAKTDYGKTALMLATEEKATGVIQVLVENMKAQYDVDFSEFGENNANRLFLLYKDKFESLINNDIIISNSKLLMFLEQDSGSISQNLGQTIKKNLSFEKVMGGPGSLIGMGIELAKAAGGRVVKSVMNEIIGDKDFMLLTDKNVILSKREGYAAYDFEDAMSLFMAEEDEVLAGVVDVYDDCGSHVLDNIPEMDWNTFMVKLRKLKKESKRLIAIGHNSNGAIAEIERKLMKLKSFVGKGLLSQEEFDAQKSKLLASV